MTILVAPPLSAASKDYWFFSKDDIKTIRISSNSEWGQHITATLKNSVAKRRKNPLEAPISEGGYKHHYFCPVHDTEFVFDWKKPTEHYCKLCGKYYTGVKKYDMAWIDNLHKINMSYLTSCTFLYLITGEPEYAGYISDMLYDYSTRYPNYKEHAVRKSAFDESAGKMFSQSLDESIWMAEAARAFVTVKKLIPKSQQESIKSQLFAPAAELIKRKRKTACGDLLRLGNGYGRNTCRLKGCAIFVVSVAVLRVIGLDHVLNGDILKNGLHAAAMVLIELANDQIVDIGNAFFGKIRKDLFSIVIFAVAVLVFIFTGIDQDRRITRADEGRVRLTDLKELNVDLIGGAIGHGNVTVRTRGGSRVCTVASGKT